MLHWYSRLVPLSYADHAQYGWRVPYEYPDLEQCTWLPVTLSEMAKASTYFPIVILHYEKKWFLAALVSVLYDSKEYSSIAQLPFAPSVMLSYPFSVFSKRKYSEKRLCIDKKCLGHLGDKGVRPIFDQRRQLVPDISERFNILCRQEIDGAILHSACELLAQKGLLTLVSGDERMRVRVDGRIAPSYRVDIERVSRLSRSDFADLQMHHALIMGAYQNSSLFHFDTLDASYQGHASLSVFKV